MVSPATVTPDFMEASHQAIARAANHPDPAVRYAVNNVPLFAMPRANSAQARAAGCPSCTYLGLWADRWAGYQASPHGIIWLFEEGISKTSENLEECVYNVLLHEIDHALQRDHILEGMRDQKVAAYMAQARP